MTRTDRLRSILWLVLCAACLMAAGGCLDGQMQPAPDDPIGKAEAGSIIRAADTGPVVVIYASHPLKPGSPPDGVRSAFLRTVGDAECSAASFYYSEQTRALRWVQDQLNERRRRRMPPRLILAGHGLGATEASETAREIIFNDRDVEIVLLLTVDAVKTGKLGSAAGVTGNAIARRIPGVEHSFTAYDAAPEPDGRQLWDHVNYYQTRSVYNHGTSMPYAENHRVDDWTGLLNHGNADDFSLTFLIADFRQALRAAAAPLPPAARKEGGR